MVGLGPILLIFCVNILGLKKKKKRNILKTKKLKGIVNTVENQGVSQKELHGPEGGTKHY